MSVVLVCTGINKVPSFSMRIEAMVRECDKNRKKMAKKERKSKRMPRKGQEGRHIEANKKDILLHLGIKDIPCPVYSIAHLFVKRLVQSSFAIKVEKRYLKGKDAIVWLILLRVLLSLCSVSIIWRVF
jgi:hypothetical protein